MNYELTEPIARGRTADVYAWGPGSILKLYQPWCPRHWAGQELRAARAVCEAGLPTPAPGELIEVDGRQGLVFERVDGISMLRDMNQYPWRLIRYGRWLARLQAQLHSLKLPDLPPYRRSLAWTLENSRHIPDHLRGPALSALAALPDGDALCHGDFHPENVLITSRGPVVIDWMTVQSGDPWADVARTSLILTVGPKGAGKSLPLLTRAGVRLYYKVYFATYRSLCPDSASAFQRWLPVMAAARLNENILPEREALIQIAARGLSAVR